MISDSRQMKRSWKCILHFWQPSYGCKNMHTACRGTRHDTDTLLIRFDQWKEFLGALEGNRNQFRIIVVYYLQMLKAKKSEVMEKIESSTIPAKEEMLSVADQLRQEGIEQSKNTTIKNTAWRGRRYDQKASEFGINL